MTVSLAIMGATFSAFQHAMRISEVATQSTDTNATLRSALDMVVRDLIQVGQGLPSGKVIPLPSGAGSTPVVRPGPTGSNLTFPYPASQNVLSAITPGADLGPDVPGTTTATDLLTAVYVDSLFDPTTCQLAPDGAAMTVTSPTPIEAGDLLMFTNALGTAMQIVTSRAGLPLQTVAFATGDPLNLNQRGAASGTVMDLQSPPGVFPQTTVSRLRMVTYYLDTAGATPELIRCLNAECVVDPHGRRTVAFGIENLQFTYDLVDGSINPTNVQMSDADLAGGGACGATACSPNQVRKVNLFIAARSRQTLAVTSQPFRNSLATQVSLRSLALVDGYR